MEQPAGGVRRVVRGWRVKGRDVLGPVDTAESPESEPSGAKIRADEDISSRRGLNGETVAREGGFCPLPPICPRILLRLLVTPRALCGPGVSCFLVVVVDGLVRSRDCRGD